MAQYRRGRGTVYKGVWHSMQEGVAQHTREMGGGLRNAVQYNEKCPNPKQGALGEVFIHYPWK